MRRRTPIIELTPTRLSLSWKRGVSLTARRCAALDPGAWDATWEERLEPLDDRLRALVEAQGCHGGWVRVAYHSPSAVAEVFSFPVAGAAAREAARLALADASGLALDVSPHTLREVARDGAGEPAQTHVLGAADSEGALEAIRALVERAGLSLAGASPIDAGLLVGCVRGSMRHEGDTPEVTLYLGEHSSILSAGARRRLLFVRRLCFGVESFVEPLAGTITPRLGGAPFRLSAGQARLLVNMVGAPRADDVIVGFDGLRGSDLLPLMLPAIQRCVAELRQSIRFGLDEPVRAGARTTITGPGGAIPGLAGLLEEQCETPVRASFAEDRIEGADLPYAVRHARRRSALLSSNGATRAAVRTARRAVWAGAVAGAAALAIDAGLAAIETRAVRREIARVEPEARRAMAVALARNEAAAATEGALRAETAIARAFQASASAPAWLAELSRLTPRSIRLLSVRTGYEGGAPVAELEGALSVDGADRDGDPLRAYIAALAASPLAAGVALGSTQSGDHEGSGTTRFTLRIALRAAPPEFVRGAAQSPEGDSR